MQNAPIKKITQDSHLHGQTVPIYPGGEAAARAAVERNEGDFAHAFDEFLDLVSRSRKFRDDGARLAMLAIFEQLGGSELTHEYRRRLQMT